MPVTEKRKRQSSDERRDQVVAAAVREFAERGYNAASTSSIAKGAGISQPYIYALFPNKRDLFLAAHDRVNRQIRDGFVEAAHGATDPEDALRRMGEAYHAQIEDRYSLLFQMQGYAAAGDPEIGPHVAQTFQALADEIERVSGASPGRVAQFLAKGMLINVTTALELPHICAAAMAEADE